MPLVSGKLALPGLEAVVEEVVSLERDTTEVLRLVLLELVRIRVGLSALTNMDLEKEVPDDAL